LTRRELGAVIREQRERLALRQLDLAGLGNTSNRFIVDLESGRPTVQLQKVLDLMDLPGLEGIVRAHRAHKKNPVGTPPGLKVPGKRLSRGTEETTNCAIRKPTRHLPA
jgi:hypothetical protein